MDLDINQYLGIFVEESKEHLQTMNDTLLELEKNPSDLAYINEIFRVAHTLKGMSGTMGFEHMAHLTHEMENLLEAARSEEIQMTVEMIDLLFECFDAIDASIDNVIEEGKEIEEDNEELIGKVLSFLGEEGKAVAISKNSDIEVDDFVLDVIREAEKEEMNAFNITITLEEDCMLKAARAFIVFNELEELGDIVYSKPAVEDIEDEKFDLDFYMIFVTDKDKEFLMDKLSSIAEVDIVMVDEFDPDMYEEKEETIEDGDKAKEEESNQPQSGVARIRKTVRVDIDRLDNLMNLVSELIIIKTRMEGLGEVVATPEMADAIEYLERITTSLHDAVMKVRMVPIERVFNRFPRLIRDLSRDLNKEIDLEMSGEETEVDRTIIDEIGDPLIHLIRNSLDHGVELPEDRIEKGKDETGIVELKAYPDGNNVVIEVGDDGKGIDYRLIRDKAIDKGIITRQEAENMSPDDCLQLLFEAGLSTSEQVSDVSGRGVGLDVVRSKIESINGNIEINTEIDKGSKFIIRIPLTLAIIQALMVKLNDEVFALPLSSITEITTINTDDIRDIQGQEILVYRGNTIPVVRLHDVLEMEFKNDSKELVFVVVNKGDRQAGLIVDDLIGQQEIVIKNLGTYLNSIKYISGATILGDGSISLIIDVNSLI